MNANTSHPVRRRRVGALPWLCLLAWLAVVGFLTFPQISDLVGFLLAMSGMGIAGFVAMFAAEVLAWVAAAVTTGLLARRFVRPGTTATVAGIAMAVFVLAIALHALNWSVYDKHSYFDAHRWQFQQVADLYDAGKLRSDEYYGETLPLHLRPLSATSKASTLLDQPGLFLPQAMGIPDDAVGYVYLGDADPATAGTMDLYGDMFDLADAEPMGGGWYWAG